MTLRRNVYDANNVPTPNDVTVYGVANGPLSQLLSDSQSALQNVEVTFSNAQLVGAGWPSPPVKLDQMVIDDGLVRVIESVETKFLGTETLVYVCMVQPLGYDRQVTVQRAVVERDAANAEIETFQDFAVVDASRVDLSGKESEAAGEVGAAMVSRFRLPWSTAIADLSARDRIKDGSRVYDVQSVKEPHQRFSFEVEAIARSDAN